MNIVRASDVTAFLLGLLYLVINFCLTWYVPSLLVCIAFCAALSFALIKFAGPSGSIAWRTAIAFSIPSLAAGLVALRDSSTLLAFALAGLGGSAVRVLTMRSNNRWRVP